MAMVFPSELANEARKQELGGIFVKRHKALLHAFGAIFPSRRAEAPHAINVASG
jgi:hypothetical protein